MSDDNLPDDLRIPLNELQADAKYLIGRVMQDAESGPMIATAILEKLSQIESASYRAILGSNPPADDLLRQAIEALRAWQEWEADIIMNGDWSNSRPRLTQSQYDRMIEMQEPRRAVLTAYDKREQS